MPDALYELAAETLAAAVVALGASPLGAPTRRYVSQGAPPVLPVCDQLAVHCAGLDQAPTDAGGFALATYSARKIRAVDLATLVITISRCYPQSQDGSPVPETFLDSYSQSSYADGRLVRQHLENEILAGNLYSKCGKILVGAATPLDTSGGAAGWTVTVQAELVGAAAE